MYNVFFSFLRARVLKSFTVQHFLKPPTHKDYELTTFKYKRTFTYK